MNTIIISSGNTLEGIDDYLFSNGWASGNGDGYSNIWCSVRGASDGSGYGNGKGLGYGYGSVDDHVSILNGGDGNGMGDGNGID